MAIPDKRPTVCIRIPPRVPKNPLTSVSVRALPVAGQETVHPAGKTIPLTAEQPTYKDVLQILYDAALITDSQGLIIEVNVRALDFFQYQASEIRNGSILGLISGADEGLLKMIQQNLANQRFTNIEAYAVRKDGSIFPAEIVVNKLSAENSVYLCFFIRDITRRKKVEEELRQSNESLTDLNRKLQEHQLQLIQSEKMAALGQIAAGVAHEINNPVGFVHSNLNTLKEYVDCFKKLLKQYQTLATQVDHQEIEPSMELIRSIRELEKKENLPRIIKDVEPLLLESMEGLLRTKEIVQNLKTFARMDVGDLKPASVNEGIESTLKIIGNELKFKCELKKILGEVPDIPCHAGQLNQVFLNLLLNAAQAIPERGTITIQTEATPQDVLIRITDDGTGIAPEDLPKIFTPFFTTKPPGTGTGLGLSISYGIILKHHGTIRVQSTLGQGTTFTIQLPRNPPSSKTKGKNPQL